MVRVGPQTCCLSLLIRVGVTCASPRPRAPHGGWNSPTEQDLEPATGYLAKYLIGYDPQQKHLVEFDANNFGAATYASADGWVNGVLTMTSPVSDGPKAPYAANRFLYSITPADTFTMDWQVSKTAAFNWTQGNHLVCKRDKPI